MTLSWMAYGYFQPLLLARFGFAGLAGTLAWYLALAGSTLAPIAGEVSDRLVRRGGNRFPVVRAGVALAAASFVAVAVTASAEAGSAARFALPFMVAIWIAGMTLFQAPALAILQDGASLHELPLAMAPVVIATTLPQAIWPWLKPWLAQLGGSVTFLAGGIGVTVATLAFGRTVPTQVSALGSERASTTGGASLPIAFLCGLASALVVILATALIPSALVARTGGVDAATIASVVALASALGASAMSRLGTRIGSGRGLVLGLAASVLCRAVAPWHAGLAPALVLATITGAALALHLATALPFSLSAQAPGRAGLATGLYVGGAIVGSQLARLLFAASA